MAATTAEPVQMDRMTVLAVGGESNTPMMNEANWTVRGHDAIKAANELRKVKPAGGKETMRAGLALKEGETRFNLHNSVNFTNRFGGEHAGDAAHMVPEEKASALKAADVIAHNTMLSLFLEAKRMPAAQRNAHVQKMLAEYGMPTNTYDALRRSSLQMIASSSDFIGMFPEIQANNWPPGGTNLLQFIEDTLIPGDDQRLASRVGTRMQEVYKKAVGLETVMTDKEKSELDLQKKVQEGKYDQQVKKIAGLLTSRGLQKAGGGQITEIDIKNWLDTVAFTPETAGDAIVSQVLGVSLESVSEMHRYAITLPTEKARLTSAIDAKRGAITLAAFLADPANKGDADIIALKNVDAEYGGLDVKYAVGQPKNADLVNFNTSGVSALYLDGSIVGLSSIAKKSLTTIEDVTAQLNARPTKLADVERSRDLRILEEEALLGELEGILGQSIADVLDERYDVMEERMGRMMQEKADKAEKDIKINIMNLRKKMSTNWIDYNRTTRKKEAHKDEIKRDVTHLAYAFDKDIALKQIIARDLFSGHMHDFDRINMIDGTDMAAPGTNTVLLTKEQLAQVEGVYKEAGNEYRDKLFADMFAARSFSDRTFDFGFGLEKTWGTLGFKRDEWQYLMQRYEPEITRGLETNSEAKAALKSLEAQGVKIDINMKWLWYVLAVLMGGAGGAWAAPIGIELGGAALKGATSLVGSKVAMEVAAGAVGGGLAGRGLVNAAVGFSNN